MGWFFLFVDIVPFSCPRYCLSCACHFHVLPAVISDRLFLAVIVSAFCPPVERSVEQSFGGCRASAGYSAIALPGPISAATLYFRRLPGETETLRFVLRPSSFVLRPTKKARARPNRNPQITARLHWALEPLLVPILSSHSFLSRLPLRKVPGSTVNSWSGWSGFTCHLSEDLYVILYGPLFWLFRLLRDHLKTAHTGERKRAVGLYSYDCPIEKDTFQTDSKRRHTPLLGERRTIFAR